MAHLAVRANRHPLRTTIVIVRIPRTDLVRLKRNWTRAGSPIATTDGSMVNTNLAESGDMVIGRCFDPKDRAREKQASRDADDLALKNGKSRKLLAQENSPFSQLLRRVDFSRLGLPHATIGPRSNLD